MTEHYYTKRPQSEQKTALIECQLREHSFQFLTSSGVFSKKGIDFGTRLIIESFTLPQIAGDILDLGCGYGAIGIALARSFPDRHITMVDINERAVALASKNAAQNNVTNVTILQSDGFQHVIGKQFAAIVTNPPIRAGKKIVHRLLEECRQFLKAEGELWLVVQKKQGAPSLQAFLETLFKDVQVVTRKKGYYILRAKNTNTN